MGGGGCPFASTTTTDAHPKVSNRDSGFWGSFPLPPPSSLPPPIRRASLVPRPFTLALLLSLSTLSTVLANLAGGAAVLRFTLARFRTLGGWYSKLSFETCTFVALTRSLAGVAGVGPGPYILTIFSERREHGRRTLLRELEFVFSDRPLDGRATCARNPSAGKPTLDGAVTLGSRSVHLLPHPLTRFSLFRESAESYFMSRELRRACVP